MTQRSSLWKRLEALERKISRPMPAMSIWHSIVAPNPEPGGPPEDLGIANCVTINVPEPGYPALEEVWWPYAQEQPPVIQGEDAVRFFAQIGLSRQTQPRDVQKTDFVIWRNAPGGAAIAKSHGEGRPEFVQPLWPA